VHHSALNRKSGRLSAASQQGVKLLFNLQELKGSVLSKQTLLARRFTIKDFFALIFSLNNARFSFFVIFFYSSYISGFQREFSTSYCANVKKRRWRKDCWHPFLGLGDGVSRPHSRQNLHAAQTILSPSIVVTSRAYASNHGIMKPLEAVRSLSPYFYGTSNIHPPGGRQYVNANIET
jgi:hypothetical protein